MFLSHNADTDKCTIFPIASVTSIIIIWRLIASRHLNPLCANSAQPSIAAATAPY